MSDKDLKALIGDLGKKDGEQQFVTLNKPDGTQETQRIDVASTIAQLRMADALTTIAQVMVATYQDMHPEPEAEDNVVELRPAPGRPDDESTS